VGRLLFIAAVVALLAVAGCTEGASGPQADVEALTAAELVWVRAYSEWAIDVNGDEYDDPGPATVTACKERLERVGDPPSERLESAAKRAFDVCPLLTERGMRWRALETLSATDELILPFLRDEQHLTLARGATQESRADTRLSGVASDVLGYAVEVRCWGVDDWERVVKEDNAWNDDNESPFDLTGWSAADDDLIHLPLEACNDISRVEAGDAATWSRSEKIDASEAVETLLHEIQHFLLPDASEAKVECAAIRDLPAFAQRFAVTSAFAHELTDLYRAEVYPKLDDEYTQGGCPRP
jgi:hypothetical protein